MLPSDTWVQMQRQIDAMDRRISNLERIEIEAYCYGALWDNKAPTLVFPGAGWLPYAVFQVERDTGADYVLGAAAPANTLTIGSYGEGPYLGMISVDAEEVTPYLPAAPVITIGLYVNAVLQNNIAGSATLDATGGAGNIVNVHAHGIVYLNAADVITMQIWSSAAASIQIYRIHLTLIRIGGE